MTYPDREERHAYGENPYGALIHCQVCGQGFRTIERLRDHEDNDANLCAERAAATTMKESNDE